MVCVRPVLVFNGTGELALNAMDSTPEPVGACGYADGPTVLLLFTAAGGDTELPILANCVGAAGIVPVFVNAAEVLMLFKLLLKFVAAVVSPVFKAAVGDCALGLVPSVF